MCALGRTGWNRRSVTNSDGSTPFAKQLFEAPQVIYPSIKLAKLFTPFCRQKYKRRIYIYKINTMKLIFIVCSSLYRLKIMNLLAKYENYVKFVCALLPPRFHNEIKVLVARSSKRLIPQRGTVECLRRGRHRSSLELICMHTVTKHEYGEMVFAHFHSKI